MGPSLEQGINFRAFFLERGANLESQAAHTHPKKYPCTPHGLRFPPPPPTLMDLWFAQLMTSIIIDLIKRKDKTALKKFKNKAQCNTSHNSQRVPCKTSLKQLSRSTYQYNANPSVYLVVRTCVTFFFVVVELLFFSHVRT